MASTASRVFAVLAIGLTTGQAVAAPEEPGAEIDRLEAMMDDLERRFLGGSLLDRRHQTTARISEGQLYYLTRDFDRAAMVMLDVVEDPSAANHPGYPDALFYLADSLFHLRNFNAATQYLEQTTVRGRPDQQQLAIGRLLEIALLTQDGAAASRHLERAGRLLSANPEPGLLYAVGKYHYRAGDGARAIDFFSRVTVESPEYWRARYFSGVAHVRDGRLDEGLQAFSEIIERGKQSPPTDSTAARVVDLSRLAVARVHYERAELDAATAAYAAVPRTSGVFDEALYESVWIAVKLGDFELALRRLEVQLINQLDALRGPDSRLLQGKLLMMMERYEESSDAFQEVLFEFGPLHSEMRRVVDENGRDLESYFHRIIGENIAEFDLRSFLPPKAAEFAGTDAETDRALYLVSDLAAQNRDVVEARRTIGRLNAALDADNRVQIFPELHEVWLKAVEVRRRGARYRGQIADRVAPARADPELVALRQTRRELLDRFSRAPILGIEQQARDARVEKQIRVIDQDAYKLSIEIQGLEAQLAAINKYVHDSARERGMPDGKDEAVKLQVKREVEDARLLQEELSALIESLEFELMRVGINDSASVEDERLENRMLGAVEAELNWLRRNGEGVPDADLARIARLDERVDALLTRSAEQVELRVSEIRRIVQQEEGNFASYSGALVSFQGETESLGGAIAARGFRTVLERIEDVVLSADVGLIDVAWKQKDDKSSQISQILSRQTADLNTLERDYREVARE